MKTIKILLGTIAMGVLSLGSLNAQVKLDYTDGKFPKGTETENWKKHITYMNMVDKLDLKLAKNCYIMKVNTDGVKFPKDKEQFKAVSKGLNKFNGMIEREIRDDNRQLNIEQVKDFNFEMKPSSLLLVTRIEKIEMGKQSGLKSVVQPMISVSCYVVDDAGNFFFNFKAQRKFEKENSLERSVYETFEELSEDIAEVF